MAIRLVALDVDGTLLHSDGSLSENNVYAVREAAAAGVQVVINSGRTFTELPQQVRDDGSYAYYIYSNGAAIADAQGQLLYRRYLPQKAAENIFSLLSHCATIIEVYAHGAPHTQKDQLTPAVLDAFCVEGCYRPVVLETRRGVGSIGRFFAENAGEVEMFNVFFQHPAQRLLCYEVFSGMPGVKVTTSMPNNLEIFSDRADKGSALQFLAAHLGLDRRELMAVGDSRNDLPMVRLAGAGVAVANACDVLKAAANVVLPVTNDEDAVACAVEMAVLQHRVFV